MKLANIFLICTVLALPETAAMAQQMRTITTYTSGSGSASEPDRSQAMDEATQQAQNWANSTCIGMVTMTNITSSGCVKFGSDDDNSATYTCTVTV